MSPKRDTRPFHVRSALLLLWLLLPVQGSCRGSETTQFCTTGIRKAESNIYFKKKFLQWVCTNSNSDIIVWRKISRGGFSTSSFASCLPYLDLRARRFQRSVLPGNIWLLGNTSVKNQYAGFYSSGSDVYRDVGFCIRRTTEPTHSSFAEMSTNLTSCILIPDILRGLKIQQVHNVRQILDVSM